MSEQQPRSMSGVEIGDKPTQDMADIFVGQLKRFVKIRRTSEGELNPRGIRLWDKVIVARICDLNRLGCEEQVSQIIKSSEASRT